MAKAIKCPNCGASQSQKTGENEYKCDFCGTNFHIENKNFSTDILNALKQVNNYKVHTPVPGIRTLRFLPLIIFLVVISVSLGIFFSVKTTVDNAIEQANTTMNSNKPADDYWGNESINKFYVFQGKKSTVIWELINQSSKGLDSAKYTIRLINPKNRKTIANSVFMTMTWDESFKFQKYLNEMIAFNEKVYFLSDESGLNIYNIYTGKLILTSDQFSQKHQELKSGIISSKWQGYRNSIELITKDGFKYYYLPQWEKLITEEQFKDYSGTRKMQNAFVFTEGDRPQLYVVNAKMDTLRNDYSVSDYYFRQALAGNFRRNDIQKIIPFSEEKVFFNAKTVFKNKSHILFLYSENLAKDSKAFLTLFSFENEIKMNWQIDLKELKGFENLIKDAVYFQYNYNDGEVVIWFWNTTKNAISLDLKSAKLNWSITL